MQSLITALTQLAPAHDPELASGYQRYAAALEQVLTPEQIETYAALIQRTGALRIFEDLSPNEMSDLTPDETAVATNIIADLAASMENRRVAALLTQRGQTNAVPDFAPPSDPDHG